jgi:hypothetical protein
LTPITGAPLTPASSHASNPWRLEAPLSRLHPPSQAPLHRTVSRARLPHARAPPLYSMSSCQGVGWGWRGAARPEPTSAIPDTHAIPPYATSNLAGVCVCRTNFRHTRHSLYRHSMSEPDSLTAAHCQHTPPTHHQHTSDRFLPDVTHTLLMTALTSFSSCPHLIRHHPHPPRDRTHLLLFLPPSHQTSPTPTS